MPIPFLTEQKDVNKQTIDRFVDVFSEEIALAALTKDDRTASCVGFLELDHGKRKINIKLTKALSVEDRAALKEQLRKLVFESNDAEYNAEVLPLLNGNFDLEENENGFCFVVSKDVKEKEASKILGYTHSLLLRSDLFRVEADYRVCIKLSEKLTEFGEKDSKVSPVGVLALDHGKRRNSIKLTKALSVEERAALKEKLRKLVFESNDAEYNEEILPLLNGNFDLEENASGFCFVVNKDVKEKEAARILGRTHSLLLRSDLFQTVAEFQLTEKSKRDQQLESFANSLGSMLVKLNCHVGINFGPDNKVLYIYAKQNNQSAEALMDCLYQKFSQAQKAGNKNAAQQAAAQPVPEQPRAVM